MRGVGCYGTRREELHGMVRAIYRTLKWVARWTARRSPLRSLGFSRMCRRPCWQPRAGGTRRWGFGARDPVLPRAGYDRLLSRLVSGGFVSPGTPFEVAVDNSLATAVVAENPPPLT